MNSLKIAIATCFALTFAGVAFADDVRIETGRNQHVVKTDNTHREVRHDVHDSDWYRRHHHHDDHQAPHIDINVGH